MRICIRINKDNLELLKSLGIRDRKGLVARKVPVRGKHGYFMRTVYVRPEMLENPYKHKLQDNPDEYDDLPKLLNELRNFNFNGKSEAEVFEMTRKMGKANGMAFKGDHTRLNEEENKINNEIYSVKGNFCENLAEYYVNNKLDCKWLIVEEEKNYKGDACLYVRDTESGVQISFHGYQNKKNVDIPITNDPNIWDGVVNSFEYSAEEYKNALENKKAADQFEKDYREYVSNYFNKKLSETLNKILKSKRVENMLQEDKKNGLINSSDELSVEVYLQVPEYANKNSYLYADNIMEYVKNSKLSLTLYNKNPKGRLRPLKSSDTIKNFINGELGKKGIVLKKLFEENFEDMEKGFILGSTD